VVLRGRRIQETSSSSPMCAECIHESMAAHKSAVENLISTPQSIAWRILLPLAGERGFASGYPPSPDRSRTDRNMMGQSQKPPRFARKTSMQVKIKIKIKGQSWAVSPADTNCASGHIFLGSLSKLPQGEPVSRLHLGRHGSRLPELSVSRS
jgi:hypothetical protein